MIPPHQSAPKPLKVALYVMVLISHEIGQLERQKVETEEGFALGIIGSL